MGLINILFWIYIILISFAGIFLILQKKTTLIISNLLIIHLSICGILFLLDEIIIGIIFLIIGSLIFIVESYFLLKENNKSISTSRQETYFSPIILFAGGVIVAFFISLITGTEWMNTLSKVSSKISKEKFSDYIHYVIILSNVFIIFITTIVYLDKNKEKGVE